MSALKYKDENGNWNNVGTPSGGGSIAVDQTYNPESENAQSGLAVAEAIEDKANLEEISHQGHNYIADTAENFKKYIGYGTVKSVLWRETQGLFSFEYTKTIDNSSRYLELSSDFSDGILGLKVGEKIHVNGDGNYVVITQYKDVSDKADKSVIGDISTALDRIIALQESIMGGE